MTHSKNADLRLLDCASTIDIKSILLDRDQARELITKFFRSFPNHVVFSERAVREMMADSMFTEDVLNVLKSPSGQIFENGVLHGGAYRYRVETNNMVVMASFNANFLIINTAWRKKHTQ